MQTLAFLTDQYYQHHRALQSRPNTLRWHRNSHRHFFELCDIKNIDDITRESIRHFIFLKSQQGTGAETIRTYVRSIKAFYKWLVEEEYIEKDFFKKKIHLPRTEERPRKLIPREDLRKIPKILDVYPYYMDILERFRTKALFLMYMNTGMRKMEAFEIKMGNVKLKERILFITRTKTRECRNVVINDDLYVALDEYCDYLREIKSKNTYLFFNSDLLLPMSDGALRHIKEKFEAFGRKRFKIKKFTLHMFRHSYISYGIADGLPLPFIMNQVGHTQMTTTQGYTHSPQKEMITKLSHYSPLHGNTTR